jgi:hypothetical protein
MLPLAVLTVVVTVEPLGVEPQAAGAAQLPLEPVSVGVPVLCVLTRPSVQR